MPNYCNNELYLLGKPDVVKAFHEKYPKQPELKDIIPPESDTVPGHNQAWGTKWGCFDGTSRVEEDEKTGMTKLIYKFQTAWGPFNTAIMCALSEGFDRAILRYAEMGQEFCGRMVALNGKILQNDSRNAFPWELKYNEEEDEYTYDGEYADLWEGSG